MSQPPSQPPQPSGGSEAPQDPQQGFSKAPAQPPQAPPVPPAPPSGPPATPPPAAPPAQPPTAPPAQPGYGYPQAPGTPPPGQPGQPGQPAQFGQPDPGNPYAQAQPGAPGPYGQPPQPGAPGQPPYGYPQQPQYPGAPAPGTPGGGSGNPLKGKPAVIIGAALAAVLVIGGGVWLVAGGDDEPTKPVGKQKTDGKQPSADAGGESAGSRDGGADDPNSGRNAGESKVWIAKNELDLPRNGAELMDIWTVGDNVIQAAYNEVTAYKSSDGSKAWSVKLPHAVCDTPPRPSADGMVVVAYKDTDNPDKSKCNQLQMIDLNTGEKGWQKQTNSGSTFDFTVTLDLEIAGENLMVARSQTGSAYRLKDGKELYTLKKDGPCFPSSFAADGDALLGVDSCISSPDKNEQLKSIDPKSGKVEWRFRTPKGYQVQKVYSVKPLVVSMVNRDKKSWNIVAFKDNGKVRSQLDGGKDTFTQRCGMSILEKELQSCVGMVASDDLFFMATEVKKSGDFDRSNEIIAFDLNTGKPKWRGKTEEPRTLLPLKVENDKLIAYVEPSFDKAGQTVEFGLSGGKPKVLLQHPETTTSVENSISGAGQMKYADGRLYATSSRLLGRDGEDEARMVSFGE